MAGRQVFDIQSPDFQIVRHPDGSVTIEATAEYGDSDNGWGSATTTLLLQPDRVVALREFLTAALSKAEGTT